MGLIFLTQNKFVYCTVHYGKDIATRVDAACSYYWDNYKPEVAKKLKEVDKQRKKQISTAIESIKNSELPEWVKEKRITELNKVRTNRLKNEDYAEIRSRLVLEASDRFKISAQHINNVLGEEAYSDISE